MPNFSPEPPLIVSDAGPDCRAIVIIPARNEASSLAESLDALAQQHTASGKMLLRTQFEILLLLNNCTDHSAAVAHHWKLANPDVGLHIIERTLPPEQAHVGTARRLLMDTAWHRLRSSTHSICGILSTDSDTIVAPDWVCRNLAALKEGADAVGGVIRLKPGELKSLPRGTRQAYRRDRRYQELIAELENILDPQAGDPWPRHLEHFGASLGCTPALYALAGGMPPVTPLEDAAFVDAIRRVDGRLRHDPKVVVYTSARLDGRATIGFSHQLRTWNEMSHGEIEHRVPTAAWLTHRFRSLRNLRHFYADMTIPAPAEYEQWKSRIEESRCRSRSTAQFLAEIDCDRLIEETFNGESEANIIDVNRNLARILSHLRLNT